MRIIKYIFLLLLLAFVALSVFVATQKGDYDIVRSKIIKSPKSVVFNYVNDYRNWENWGSWNEEDSQMKFSYPEKTSGAGASYSWTGKDGDGNMKTIFVKENDSLSQKMNYNGSTSSVFWSFKDTVGGTKVTWRTKGTMPFMFKIYAVTKGGADKVIGNMYEKSLDNLNKTLNYEINTYTVKVNGIVTKIGGFYLHQTITSTIPNLSKNLRIMKSKLMYFFKKNNVPMSGRPFVIYHTYDVANGITNLSVCVPIKDEIFIIQGSDIMSGKLESFQAVKTTLTGDYSHSKEAWDKTDAYISTHNLMKNPAGPSMEVYTKGVDLEKSPSKWVTDIYVAVLPKIVVQPKIFVAKPKIIPETAPVPVEKPTTGEL